MLKVRLDTFSNSWYSPGAGPLKRVLWYFTNILFLKNGWFPFSGIRLNILRLFGAQIGNGVLLKPCVNIKYPWLLEIGDFCWIGENVWIDNLVLVKIGSHVCISQGAVLITGNHNYKDPGFGLITGEIHLEDGCWVGAGAHISPGVKCGEGSILSMGSVATQDLQAMGIYQGNPAVFKKLRIISDVTGTE